MNKNKCYLGKNLKTRLDKEMENIQQAKKDKDLLDDFLALHQFQVHFIDEIKWIIINFYRLVQVIQGY